MVQFVNLPAPTSASNEAGKALGSGLYAGMQTGINRGNLSRAFQDLDPNANFTEQLKQIAPILLTTPGGAQALAELAPVLGKQSENRAMLKSIEDTQRQNNEQQNQAIQAAQQSQNGSGNAQGGDQEQFKRPKAPYSKDTPFPQITAGPQPQKEMSNAEINNRALTMMRNSIGGKPISYPEAFQAANIENQNIRSTNQQIQKEKDLRNDAQKALSADLVNRAQNAGYIKGPEDRTIAEKLSVEARNAPDAPTAWEYVRTKMKEVDSAKGAIQRELGLAGPFTNAYRKLNGTYKDQEEIIKDLQPNIEKFRKLGLYDEAKNMLVNDLGFGNEQAHATVFPMSKKENVELETFPKNQNRPSITANLQFPDEGFALKPEQFNNFKDKLADYLEKNPNVDLVTMRGNLNQDKRYSWKDIQTGLDQLVEERRFDPDIEQEKQLNTLRTSPTPGLGAYFQYLWSGKK